MTKFLLSTLLAGTILSTQTANARIYQIGNSADVTKTTQPTLCLAGGSSDDYWVEGWKRLLTSSGGGDVVIIRPDGNKGTYESWIYNDSNRNGLPKVDSVTTIALGRASDASSAAAVTAVRNAELVFFDGGDQSIYLNYIEGSPLETALDYALHVRKIPMGGTSAGMAILAGIDFSARYPVSKKVGTVSSQYALNDPTATFVDLDTRTLVPPFLNNVITDTHFSQRQREGRLAAFMARAVYNNYPGVGPLEIKGIAADEGTAFCYDMISGIGKVYGLNKVQFTQGNSAIERITPGTSLDWYGQKQAIKVYSIPASSTNNEFNLTTWSGTGGSSLYWYVDGTDTTNAVFGTN